MDDYSSCRIETKWILEFRALRSELPTTHLNAKMPDGALYDTGQSVIEYLWRGGFPPSHSTVIQGCQAWRHQ